MRRPPAENHLFNFLIDWSDQYENYFLLDHLLLLFDFVSAQNSPPDSLDRGSQALANHICGKSLPPATLPSKNRTQECVGGRSFDVVVDLYLYNCRVTILRPLRARRNRNGTKSNFTTKSVTLSLPASLSREK